MHGATVRTRFPNIYIYIYIFAAVFTKFIVEIPVEITELLSSDTSESAFSQGNNRAVVLEPV